MKEVWKNIKRYEGYKCSNTGKVFSLKTKRLIDFSGKNERYLCFYPCEDSKKVKYKVHHCIWEAFNGLIPDGYVVHHINGNSKDNRLSNLCLMDALDHQRLHYKEKKEKMIESSINSCSKPVKQYTVNGEFVEEYESAMDAARKTGIDNRKISACCLCKDNHNSAGDYLWCFSGEEDKIKEKISMYEPRQKTVLQYTLDGVFVKEYNSTMDVQRELGIHNTSVSRCCLGKQKKAGNYIFKYKNNDSIAA